MTVAPWSSGLGVASSVKACLGPVGVTSLFLFLLSLVSVSAALSFVSEVGIAAWEFSGCGLGCGCKDKEEHCSWLPPKWVFGGSRSTPVGKSLKAKQGPDGLKSAPVPPCPSLHSPLRMLCSLFSQDNHTCVFIPKAKPALNMNPFTLPSFVVVFLHPFAC